MRSLNLICLFGLSLFLGRSNAQLQQVIGSAGDSHQTAGFVVDFTLGEVVIDTYSGSQYLTSGFHQPDISLSRIPTHEAINILVYPNPTRSQLTIGASQAMTMNVAMTDVLGHAVLEHTTCDTRTTFDVEHLPAGHYILRLEGEMGYTTRLITKVR